jgi:hypothetical protein
MSYFEEKAKNLTAIKDKVDEFERKYKEAQKPFISKEKKALEQKRKKDKKLCLKVEEKDEIWRPFWGTARKIGDELFGNF